MAMLNNQRVLRDLRNLYKHSELSWKTAAIFKRWSKGNLTYWRPETPKVPWKIVFYPMFFSTFIPFLGGIWSWGLGFSKCKSQFLISHKSRAKACKLRHIQGSLCAGKGLRKTGPRPTQKHQKQGWKGKISPKSTRLSILVWWMIVFSPDWIGCTWLGNSEET